MDEPHTVLVTRLKRIGDAILALSVVEAVREAFPSCTIDFLAEAEPAQAAVGHPAVDRVLTLDRAFAAWMPASPSLLWELRARRYDWVLDLYGNPRSALLSAWTGAPVRVGPARRGRRHLYTHPIPPTGKPLSAIAHGQSDDLIHRAADVVLKEKRRLVLVVREAPLSEIHLENMLKLTRMGAIVSPTVPAFYDHPRTIDDLVNHTVGRLLDLFDIHLDVTERWSGMSKRQP